MGGSGEPVRSVITATEALRYAMSLPVATTVSGIDSLQVLRQLSIARGFTPMTTIEMPVRTHYEHYATDRRELY